MSSGHYIAVIKAKDNKWYKISDESVEYIEQNSGNINIDDLINRGIISGEVERKDVYLAFYAENNFNSDYEPKGIVNNGHTCFFNAIIQNLINLNLIYPNIETTNGDTEESKKKHKK